MRTLFYALCFFTAVIFSADSSDGAGLMPYNNRTAFEGCRLADNVYDYNKKNYIGPYAPNKDGYHIPRNYELFRQSNPTNTGFQAAAYRNPQTNEVFIVYRGTELNSGDIEKRRDVKTDTSLVTAEKLGINEGSFRAQTNDANVFTDSVLNEVRSKYPDAKIVISGHSLGGAIAQYQGVRTGYETYTFNAPGVATFIDSEFPHTPANNVTNFIREGDPIGNFGNHEGYQVFYPNPGENYTVSTADGILQGEDAAKAIGKDGFFDKHPSKDFVVDMMDMEPDRIVTPNGQEYRSGMPGEETNKQPSELFNKVSEQYQDHAKELTAQERERIKDICKDGEFTASEQAELMEMRRNSADENATINEILKEAGDINIKPPDDIQFGDNYIPPDKQSGLSDTAKNIKGEIWDPDLKAFVPVRKVLETANTSLNTLAADVAKKVDLPQGETFDKLSMQDLQSQAAQLSEELKMLQDFAKEKNLDPQTRIGLNQELQRMQNNLAGINQAIDNALKKTNAELAKAQGEAQQALNNAMQQALQSSLNQLTNQGGGYYGGGSNANCAEMRSTYNQLKRGNQMVSEGQKRQVLGQMENYLNTNCR